MFGASIMQQAQQIRHVSLELLGGWMQAKISTRVVHRIKNAGIKIKFSGRVIRSLVVAHN